MLKLVPALARNLSPEVADVLVQSVDDRLRPSRSVAEIAKDAAGSDLKGGGLLAQIVSWLGRGGLGSGTPTSAVGQVDQIVKRREETLNVDEGRVLTLTAISTAHEVSSQIRAERLRQARQAFNAALVLMIVGVLVIFIGVGLLLAGGLTAGTVTAGLGVVCEIASLLLFNFYRETNNRLDAIARDLTLLEVARTGVFLIEKVTDPTKRDEAIIEIVRSLQRADKRNPPEPASGASAS
jgi:hypothetical protein